MVTARTRFALIAGFAFIASLALMAEPAQAGVYVYPQKGQSDEQKNKDSGECNAWAVQQSGYDPMNTSSAPQTGGAGRGAAKGAAVGAIGGAIAGDAGKGAAIGAATGGVMGGARRRSANNSHEQQQAAGSSEHAKAFSACMEARGYSVK